VTGVDEIAGINIDKGSPGSRQVAVGGGGDK
jgi:hypothetical protein